MPSIRSGAGHLVPSPSRIYSVSRVVSAASAIHHEKPILAAREYSMLESATSPAPGSQSTFTKIKIEKCTGETVIKSSIEDKLEDTRRVSDCYEVPYQQLQTRPKRFHTLLHSPIGYSGDSQNGS